MKKANIDKPTAEQIAEWKEKYGEDKVFKMTSEDGEKSCILRKPGRKDLDYATAAGDGLKFNEALMNNCWLGGDREMVENDDYFLECGAVLASLVKRGKATLEKL